MGEFITLFINYIKSLISLLENTVFTIGQYQVSYMALIFAFLVTCFIINVFWRGART